MAGSLNKIQLIGHVGREPELKRTQSGTAVADFSLATTERFTDKQGQRQEQTEWHNIVVWNRSAETASQYLKKGALIYFEGKAKTRSWDDPQKGKQYRTEYHGTFKFLDRAPQQNQNHSGGGSNGFQNNNFGEPPSSNGFPSEPNFSQQPAQYMEPPQGLPVEDELPF